MRKLFVILAAITFCVAFTVPAAAEFNLSGYAAMNTFWLDVDPGGGADSDKDLDWTLDNVCSRFTASFKDGPVSGLVQIRPLNGSYFRHWWGEWNFGAGSLGVGQTWTPDFQGLSSSAYACGFIGNVGDSGGTCRAPMVQLKVAGLKLALSTPNTSNVTGAVDTDTSMPKIIASYGLNLGPANINLFGGYNSYEEIDATDTSYDVTSTLYGIKGSVGVGAISIGAMVWQATNPQEYGGMSLWGPTAGFSGTDVQDVDTLAYGVDIGFKVSDALSFNAGYLASESELDAPGDWKDPNVGYHVQAVITLAKNVTLIPEYGVADMDEVTQNGVTTEEACTTWYGAWWKIAF